MKIVNSILTKNPCYKAGRKIIVKGLMLHSVGCSQPNASAFISYWNNESFKSACVHAFIDAKTGDVYQTLPWNHRGWHCGSGSNGSGNNTYIGIEMCEPDCIKYVGGSTFNVSDKEKAQEMVKRTYDSAVELFAMLCKNYDLNPLTDIISHSEGHKKGIASNHADPEHLWKGLGLHYTMDTFRKDVANLVGTEKTQVIYRVQAGAYSIKENADKQLKKVIEAGFKDAFVKKVNNLYKIQVGAYTVKANADNQLKKIKNAGFDAFITTE